MKVIGISGLHNSVEFKRRELPGLTEREYRISQGFDSAAAIVVDGTVRAAAAEERFSGVKATGAFPAAALRDCLRTARLGLGDIDVLAHGFGHRLTELEQADPYLRDRYAEVYDPDLQPRWLAEHFPLATRTPRFVPVAHHLAHAASAYYPSGLADCLVLVADGMGETESLTVAAGVGGKLEVLHRIPAMHSLGMLYGIFTLYLGFEMAMDEYKVMGLASSGDRRRYYGELMRMVELRPGGTFTVPLLARDLNLLERETHRGVLRAIEDALGPAREPGAAIGQRHRDIAAAVQAALETCLLHVLRHYQEETSLRSLCMAGGVALNCTANGVVARSRIFERVFVPPGAGDDGTAVGAALYVQAMDQPEMTLPAMDMPYWGSCFSDEEIRAAVCAARADCVWTRFDSNEELARDTAAALEAGQVVAWFQGAMEFGPRALGNRSILADPRDERMRDHINSLIKRREDFRPFAPVVTREAAAQLFEITPGTEGQYAHMLFTTRTRPAHRHELGAVTHIDGSARVQVIGRQHNALLWTLLEAFAARTGVPALLNTSFNLRGQPIVRDPQTAIETFLRGKLDRLVMGRYVLTARTAGHAAAGPANDAPAVGPRANGDGQ
ncbi:MAG TPA: carbamoyltransferase C-terminal domain-containing protein [Streptosporangiaceae bacterium]|nr:carbamoyltransferase C-terminal domain-containing protein [Streptosporangiaceae bacterium]